MLIEKLDKIQRILDGVTGRLLVAATKNKEVKQAMEMVNDASYKINDLINDEIDKESGGY